MSAEARMTSIEVSQGISTILKPATTATLRDVRMINHSMQFQKKHLAVFIFLAAILSALPVYAQTSPGRGRFSFFSTNTATQPEDGDSWTHSELIFSFSLQGPMLEENGLEYGVDFRARTYPSTEQDARISIYDAYFGVRTMNGRLGLRGGQMWLNELGALGSFGGVTAEWRQPREDRRNRLRIGGFFGYEPKIQDFEYEPDVKKFGGYFAVDGKGSRRHVFGLVSIRNSGLTERNVFTATNFIPVGSKFYFYQGSEVDLTGPGGNGSGKFTYFYTNARYRPVGLLEFQGTYHRGRSIDARTITNDMVNGRPISPNALEGLLFESAGGRIWVRLPAKIRVFGGYFRSKNNRDDSSIDRTSFGLIVPNLMRSGVDIHISDTRIKRAGLSSDSWYASLGRNLGHRVYISGEYASSLAVLRVLDSENILVETNPRNHRIMLSGIFHLSRLFSLNVTAEHFFDDTVKETRIMSGITYRFW